MSSSAHRDIVDALDRLRSGASSLSSEQYVRLLDAVEQASTVLHLAPRGGDPAATGVWYHHERGPALARLADALNLERRRSGSTESGGSGATAPGLDAIASPRGSAEANDTEERQRNAAVIRALQESLRIP